MSPEGQCQWRQVVCPGRWSRCGRFSHLGDVSWSCDTTWLRWFVGRPSERPRCFLFFIPSKNFLYRMGDVRLFTRGHFVIQKWNTKLPGEYWGSAWKRRWKLTLFTFSLILPFCRSMKKPMIFHLKHCLVHAFCKDPSLKYLNLNIVVSIPCGQHWGGSSPAILWGLSALLRFKIIWGINRHI